MRIAFITNLSSHYRQKLFELLAIRYQTTYYFFSDGSEWYWHRKHRLLTGNFTYKYLRGFSISGVRINLTLLVPNIYKNSDVIIKCINGKFALLASFIMSIIYNKPFILWTGIWQHPQTFIHRLSFPIVKYIYNKVNAIVVYGKHVKKYLVSIGVDERKIFVAWNSVDNTKFNRVYSSFEKQMIRESVGINTKYVIMFSGRFEEVKGLVYLLQAFYAIQDKLSATLLLVGNGSKLSEIKEWIIKFNCKNVIFTDYVENDALVKFYAIANLFVLPSITTPIVKETWGLVVNEAMCQGCPVVTTDAVGAAAGGLVQEGKTGYIVPEKDSEALGKAMYKILNDERLQSAMREATLKRISSWDHAFQAQGFIDAIEYVTSA